MRIGFRRRSRAVVVVRLFPVAFPRSGVPGVFTDQAFVLVLYQDTNCPRAAALGWLGALGSFAFSRAARVPGKGDPRNANCLMLDIPAMFGFCRFGNRGLAGLQAAWATCRAALSVIARGNCRCAAE